MARSKTVGQLPMTDTEVMVMRCFWTKKTNLFAVDVVDILNKDFDIKYANQTVSVILMHLKDKGYLKFERVGRGYQFIPNITEKEYYSRKIEKKVIDLGTVDSILSAFFENEKIKGEDKAELVKLMAKYK